MLREKVCRKAAEAGPWILHDALGKLLFGANPERLTPIQRVLHLTSLYDGEINNGGHFQFFDNNGIAQARKTLAALKKIAASEPHRILQDAIRICRSVKLSQGKFKPSTSSSRAHERATTMKWIPPSTTASRT